MEKISHKLGIETGKKHFVSRILGREMEKFDQFPDEKFWNKFISLPVSCGKQDFRPSLGGGAGYRVEVLGVGGGV